MSSDKLLPLMLLDGEITLWVVQATGFEKQSTGLVSHSCNTVGFILECLKKKKKKKL